MLVILGYCTWRYRSKFLKEKWEVVFITHVPATQQAQQKETTLPKACSIKKNLLQTLKTVSKNYWQSNNANGNPTYGPKKVNAEHVNMGQTTVQVRQCRLLSLQSNGVPNYWFFYTQQHHDSYSKNKLGGGTPFWFLIFNRMAQYLQRACLLLTLPL